MVSPLKSLVTAYLWGPLAVLCWTCTFHLCLSPLTEISPTDTFVSIRTRGKHFLTHIAVIMYLFLINCFFLFFFFGLMPSYQSYCIEPWCTSGAWQVWVQLASCPDPIPHLFLQFPFSNESLRSFSNCTFTALCAYGREGGVVLCLCVNIRHLSVSSHLVFGSAACLLGLVFVVKTSRLTGCSQTAVQELSNPLVPMFECVLSRAFYTVYTAGLPVITVTKQVHNVMWAICSLLVQIVPQLLSSNPNTD